MSDPLRPEVSLLCKLGSIAVHTEELLSPYGHDSDREALRGMMQDPDVREWLCAMGRMSLVPLKRTPT